MFILKFFFVYFFMKNQIIIARYNENLDWVKKLIDKYDIFIYNKQKGIPKEIEKFVKEKKIRYEELDNVGRESHTYFHHILKERNSFANKLFFTQAEPFDHIDPNNDNASPEFFYDQLDDFFNGEYDFKGYGKKRFIWSRGIGNKTPTMEKLWGDLFDEKLEEHEFNNGGIFGVKKELILNRSKDFYKYCLKSLEYDKNPMEGFCYERLWSCIFEKNYKVKI